MVETMQLVRPSAAELGEWNNHFNVKTPQDLIAWAAREWGERMALSCSFGGAAGMVLLDMVAQIAPKTPVLYVDTGLLFGATYQLVEQVRERYGIQLRAIQPTRTLVQQAEQEGAALWERNPDRCCGLRKVQPMAEVLSTFDAWITGVRQANGASRTNTRLIEWSDKYQLVKLNPLVSWSDREVWRYIHAHNVPYNPLLDQGYRSLGCATCTHLPTNDDPRSGRWIGFNKTECGLHVEQR